MGEIATSRRLITIYYHPESIRAKKAIAYAKAEGLRLQKINILKTTLTGTQISEIADRLNLKIKDLVNQNHKAYRSIYEPSDLSSEDWIKLIQHHPEIMKQPIAIQGKKTILVETPSDIIKI